MFSAKYQVSLLDRSIWGDQRFLSFLYTDSYHLATPNAGEEEDRGVGYIHDWVFVGSSSLKLVLARLNFVPEPAYPVF